jgi:cytidylate kinase
MSFSRGPGLDHFHPIASVATYSGSRQFEHPPLAASTPNGCQTVRMSVDPAPMLIVTGPPGAGKSTVARIIADSYDPSVLLKGDDFHHFIRKGYVKPWLAGSERQNEVVIDATATSAVTYALGGYHVIVEGIIGPWFMERWLSHVPGDVPVHYVVLRPSEDVALQRAIRRSGSADLVDARPVAFMHQVFVERGGFGKHILDTSAQTAEESAVDVISLVSEGHLLVR